MSSEGAHRLNYAFKNLRRLWDEVGANWNDDVRRDFEQHYILPLSNRVSSTVHAMNEIDEVTQRLKRECS